MECALQQRDRRVEVALLGVCLAENHVQLRRIALRLQQARED
jgi:hypothetical protein